MAARVVFIAGGRLRESGRRSPPLNGVRPGAELLVHRRAGTGRQRVRHPLRRPGRGLDGTGSYGTNLGNDPSAGSPTETLLRLLLPLNDQV